MHSIDSRVADLRKHQEFVEEKDRYSMGLKNI